MRVTFDELNVLYTFNYNEVTLEALERFHKEDYYIYNNKSTRELKILSPDREPTK